MSMSIKKTQSTVGLKEPIHCKLAIDDQIIEQVGTFKYLGVDISNERNIIEDVHSQSSKAAMISGSLRSLILTNKHMAVERKARIYKTGIRPIIT